MDAPRRRLVRQYFHMAVDLKPSKRYILGRSLKQMEENCQMVRCVSEFVSRQHAIVACDEAGIWKVGDAGSTNGTYLNDDKILSSPSYQRELREGDLISLGPIDATDEAVHLVDPRYFIFKFEVQRSNLEVDLDGNFSDGAESVIMPIKTAATAISAVQKKSYQSHSRPPSDRSERMLDVRQQSSSRSLFPANKAAGEKEKYFREPSVLDLIQSESEDDSSDGCSTERPNVVQNSKSMAKFRPEVPKIRSNALNLNSTAQKEEKSRYTPLPLEDQGTKKNIPTNPPQPKPKYYENDQNLQCSVNLTNIFQVNKGRLYLLPVMKDRLKKEGCSFSTVSQKDQTDNPISNLGSLEKKRPLSESDSDIERTRVEVKHKRRFQRVKEILSDSESEDDEGIKRPTFTPKSKELPQNVRPDNTKNKTSVVDPLVKERQHQKKYDSIISDSESEDDEGFKRPTFTSKSKELPQYVRPGNTKNKINLVDVDPIVKERQHRKKYDSSSSESSKNDEEENKLPVYSKPFSDEEIQFMDYDDVEPPRVVPESDEETDTTVHNYNTTDLRRKEKQVHFKRIASASSNKSKAPQRQIKLLDHAPAPYSHSRRKHGTGTKERTSIISPEAVPVPVKKATTESYSDSIDDPRKASEERNEMRKRKLHAVAVQQAANLNVQAANLNEQLDSLHQAQDDGFKRPNVPKAKFSSKTRSHALYQDIVGSESSKVGSAATDPQVRNDATESKAGSSKVRNGMTERKAGSSEGRNDETEPKAGSSKDMQAIRKVPYPSKELQSQMPLNRLLGSDLNVPTSTSGSGRPVQAAKVQPINRINPMQKHNVVLENRPENSNNDVQFHINMKRQTVSGPVPRSGHGATKLYEDTIYQDICKWQPSWIEQKNESEPPRVEEGAYNSWNVLSTLYSYNNYSSYQSTFYPLMLHELWAAISEDAEKNSKLPGGESQVSIDKVSKMELCPMVSQDPFSPKQGTWIELRCHSYACDINEFRNSLDLCIIKFTYKRKNSRNEYETLQRKTFGFAAPQGDVIEEIKPNNTTIIINHNLWKQNPHFRFKYSFTVNFHDRYQIDVAQEFPCYVERIAYISPKIREYKAFVSLPKLSLCNNILSPTRIENPWTEADVNKTMRNLVPYCTSLNPRQKSIIDYISRRIMRVKQPDIMLVHGPPGTGKTRTIVGLILQLVTCQDYQTEIPKILVCTPSNTAIDEIVVRIHEYFQDKPVDQRPIMVRLGDSCKTAEISLQYTPDLLARNQKRKNSPLDSIENTIKAKREEVKKKYMEKNKLKTANNSVRIKALEREIKEGEEQILLLQQKKETVQLSPKEKDQEDVVKRKNEIIKSAHIVCSTLNACTNSKMRNLFEVFSRSSLKNPPPKFTCCIIDEATQTTEPETLSPLIFNMDKLVMVGDPCQLDATVLSKKAKEGNYGFSLFHRLYNTYNSHNPNPVMMLRNQYRMHSEILKWPNDYFYGGKLIQKPIRKMGTHVECPLPPYAFFNLSSVESSNYRGEISNEQEMLLVMELLKCISLQISQSRSPFTVGVITPYSKQKSVLSGEIRRKVSSLAAMIEVDTVDSFQGREKDIIIISCVRTESLGFLTNSKRLNVALTRAVHSLFIIGNADFLKKNDMWESLIEDAENRKLLYNIPKDKACQPSYIANFFRKNLSPSKSEIPDERRMQRRLDR